MPEKAISMPEWLEREGELVYVSSVDKDAVG